MEESLLHLSSPPSHHRLPPLPKPTLPKLPLNPHPALPQSRPLLSFPSTPLKSPPLPKLPTKLPANLLFLDSLNLDPLSLVSSHPQILSLPLPRLKSSVSLLLSLGLSPPSLRRLLSICPQALTLPLPSLSSSVSFLLLEAGVPSSLLPRALHRRPRLLVSDVATQLRPTLYFLQMLGIANVSQHTHLLSCSVEEKLIPKMQFFRNCGCSPSETKSMFRRYPQLFCYGVEGNLEVKLGFLKEEMGREIREVVEFPHYFSYSLEKRIKKRHLVCEEKGVVFGLPAMLKPSDKEFRERVEVCVGSSPPVRDSPLWYESLNLNSNSDNTML